MINREKISLNDSIVNMIIKMSEGNIGACSVCTDLIKNNPDFGMMTLLDLDDMNMRGSQIWVGYKDHCKENLEMFIEACRNRDQVMVNTVNRVNSVAGQRAVTGGSSFS